MLVLEIRNLTVILIAQSILKPILLVQQLTGTLTGTGGWAGTSSAGVLGGVAMAFSCGINGRIGLPAVNSTMVFGGSEFQWY